MTNSYKPNISEGFYPHDAGWTEAGTEATLLVSVPELTGVTSMKVNQFDYAWLFDPAINAYIFCFQINSKAEHAVIFQFEHAGRLLLETEAYERFSIAITSEEFKHIKEETPYLFFENISINRQPLAGW
ncbi:hypothetical protein ACFSCX_22580 [Bacillus salitolerans]|uniref:Uncharacterized protein n=1 Tax=Bacillus salitolerans TaxID=1437434 RepID=A0ABW4LXH0_9BACI